MATITFPDPAVTHSGIGIRITVSDGVGSATVGFYADGTPSLPYASFDPSDFTVQEQAANQAAIGLLIAKAKARQEEIAAANGNVIEWV